MKGFKLSPQEVQQLKLLHKKQKNRRAADKIKAIVLLGTGWTLLQVSEALLLDTETLRRYVDKYRKQDIHEVLQDSYKGRSSFLSTEHTAALKEHLSEYTYPDVKTVIAYVKKEFGITYKYTGMRSVLASLGFVYKKPKVVPGQSDPVEAMKFLQRYEEIRRTGSPLYFMDGVHPQHNSRPSFGWILKGATKALQSNTGRKRLNINGVVNIDTKELLVTADESVNAQSTIKLFNKILKKHQSEDKLYIVCDNAGYYRSTMVQDYIREVKKIELIFLPPYSPYLNLIERVWKYFNTQVLHNKYYPTFSEFKDACLNFFKRRHKRVLDKKLVEKFHFSDKNMSNLKLCS